MGNWSRQGLLQEIRDLLLSLIAFAAPSSGTLVLTTSLPGRRISLHFPNKSQAFHGLTPSHRPCPLPGILGLFNCQIPPYPSKINCNIDFSVISPAIPWTWNESDSYSPPLIQIYAFICKIIALYIILYLFTIIFLLQSGELLIEEPGLSNLYLCMFCNWKVIAALKVWFKWMYKWRVGDIYFVLIVRQAVF